MEPGQLVKCVVGFDLDYAFLLLRAPQRAPRFGSIYTVDSVITNCKDCGQGHVFLDEVQSPYVGGFPARWFKPCAPVNFEKFMAQLMPANEQRFEG